MIFPVFLIKTKARPWRHIYNHIEIPRPKHRDIEIRGLKHHSIGKRRQLNHDIVISWYFFRVQIRTHDIGIPRLKNDDIEIPRLKSRGIEFQQNFYPYVP